MLKLLPIIFIVLALVTGIFYFQRREALKKQMDDLLQKSKISMTTGLITPTPVIPVKNGEDLNSAWPTVTPTPDETVTPTPAVEAVATTKGGLTPVPATAEATATLTPASTKVVSTRVETVCTPVYGMANSCAEHVVVDTGLDTGTFMNLAGLSYLGGLVAFIKAKRRA